MFLLIGSFIAGMITVFAPCIVALLPVIIGGSISGKVEDKKRPLIIAASLATSLIIFTVLLKATTLFIDVPPATFTIISGVILVLLGASLFFPNFYDSIMTRLNIQAKSQQLMGKAGGKGQYVGPIITGAALGPVFSSCSPVYAYIIATILPVNFGEAMLYITSYVLGLSLMLLLIGYLGQRFLRRFKFIANPRGWFIRVIATLFIVIGLMIVTGYDKRFQTFVSTHTPFNFDSFSSTLIPNATKTNGEGVLNVDAYDAPEFKGLTNWINSKPLTKEDLKGKVVLIDFWTYSCINCIRTQPYLKDWYSTYKDSDFVIVGLHAPEFSFEKNPKNVRDAVKKAGLEYPIALDNDFSTWNAYQNQYWPGTYLLDKEGKVRRYHGGEGEYKQTEQAIRALLGENGGRVPERTTKALDGKVPVTEGQSPETYLGTKRASNFVGTPLLTAGTGQKTFTPAELKEVNDWTLSGTWDVSTEGIKAVSDSTLQFRLAAKEVYFVTAGDGGGKQIEVLLDGSPISQTGFAGSSVKDSRITVNEAELYRAVKFKQFTKDATIELRVPAGVQLNVFTFGS
jgi:cytochrome c biogenesis protein CcdA/thiol-disulfide isomerase/thioredoxin